MSATAKYSLRYPDGTAFVRDGATAMRSLAEDVENSLLAPFLCTRGADDPVYSNGSGVARWGLLGAVQASRGNWTSPQNPPQLMIPPTYGVYLVQASIRFGGKSEADTFQTRIESTVNGSGTVTLWNYEQVEVADTSGRFTQLHAGAIVPITQANEGIQVTATYGGTQAPTNPAPDTVHRLQIYRLSLI